MVSRSSISQREHAAWRWIVCLWSLVVNSRCFGQTTEEETQVVVETGLLDIVFSGGWIGFSIIMLLLALSMTAAYLVFEQLITLRASEVLPDGLDTQVQGLLQQGKPADAELACRDRPSFLSFVMLSGLNEIDDGWRDIEKALEDATAEQSAKLYRKIEYLSVIGNIAPMVGLLGTVTGMILAFQRVATTQGVAGAADLAEGIYQALVTTVGGLIVAIPSLGAFAIFRNRVDQFSAEAAYAAQRAFSPIKRRKKRTSATRHRPPPPPPPPGESHASTRPPKGPS